MSQRHQTKILAIAALAALAGACSSSHSSAPKAAPAGGATAASGAAPVTSSAPDGSAATASAAAAGSARTLSADALKKALLTDADLPGYQSGPLADGTAAAPPAGSSRDCAKVLGSIGSLTAGKGKGVTADEALSGGTGNGKASAVVVRLEAFPTADDAGASVVDLRQGLASCKIVKGAASAGAPVTAVPVTGVGDEAAAFTMDLGAGLVGGTGFLTARVGTVTVTVEMVGANSGTAGQAALSAQLKDVAAKQVAKVQAALSQ